MKNKYFLIFATFFILNMNGQVIDFQDSNLKSLLLLSSTDNSIARDLNGDNFKIDANNDSEIQLSEAIQVSYLNLSVNNIANLNGINYFINLLHLDFSLNQITGADISNLTNLQYLNCAFNQLTSLDVSNLINLQYLDCAQNQLVTLNILNLTNLQELICSTNFLNSLNVSNSENLIALLCRDNELVSLYIKNGSTEFLDFSENPNLSFICADEEQINDVQNLVTQYGYANCMVDTSCILPTINFKSKKPVTIYPSPTKDFLNVVFETDEQKEIEIYSLRGKLIMSIQTAKKKSYN